MTASNKPLSLSRTLFTQLSILDRLLTPLILLCMIAGVLIGVYVPNVQKKFDTVQFNGVSVPIAIGLIVMIWPVLTKVQFEAFPVLLGIRRSSSHSSSLASGSSRTLYIHLAISFVLNWLIAPFAMLALAHICLPSPSHTSYRIGLILVGLARCIAMVLVWNRLAGGNEEYCAILVLVNSVLQLALYPVYALLFVGVIEGDSHAKGGSISYGKVAISVLIYLGIPLALGIATRYGVWLATSKSFLEKRFLPFFSPLTLLGLLYTVIVIFANQGKRVVDRIGIVARLVVPLTLYFLIMWGVTFYAIYRVHRWAAARRAASGKTLQGDSPDSAQSATGFEYELGVVQAFTAASNNFELAIAIAVSIYGVESNQALAATIGPLVEVPVLLLLTWIAMIVKLKGWYDASPAISPEMAGGDRKE